MKLNERVRRGIIVFFLLFRSGGAEFLEVNTEGEYENYGAEDYEGWIQAEDTQVWYDGFGNFLLQGVSVLEIRRKFPEFGGNVVRKYRPYQNFMNHLVIAKDSFGKTHSRIMYGDEIKTQITGLTFKKAQFRGLRWDIFTDRNELTILATNTDRVLPLGERGWLYIGRGDEPAEARYISPESHYLYGFHNVFRLGDVMKVGGTYLNHHNYYSFIQPGEGRKNSLFGYDPFPAQEGDLTGHSLLGLDLRGHKFGWDFEAEVVCNEKFFDGKRFDPKAGYVKDKKYIYYQYSEYALTNFRDVAGKRERIYQDKTKGRSFAFFLRSRGKLGPFELGGEKYYVDPYYLFSYDPVFETYRENNSFLPLPNLTDPDAQRYGRRKAFSDYVFVEDNDDFDRYADSAPDALVVARNQVCLMGDWDGVFPGLDENQNNIPDVDEDRDGFPDYDQDFLICLQDPPEYTRGNDDNNNEIIDKFENDRRPDYTYPRNRDGWGFYSQYPLGKTIFTFRVKLEKELEDLGKHAEYGSAFLNSPTDPNPRRQPHVGKNNFVELIATDQRNLGFKGNILGKLILEGRVKKVEDTIPDDCVEQRRTERDLVDKEAGIVYRFLDDPILYEDSLVSSLFAQLTYTGIRNFNFTTKVKLVNNRQNKEKNTVNFLGYLARFRYRVPLIQLISPLKKIAFLKQLYLQPMGKYITQIYDWTNDEFEAYERTRAMSRFTQIEMGTAVPEEDRTQILRVRSLKKDEYKMVLANLFIYEFSPALSLTIGFQQRTDIFRLAPERSFSTFLRAIQLVNRSQFRGYDIAVILGYELSKKKELTLKKVTEEEKVYVRIVAGF